jgi:hypothetical protein
MSNVKRLGMVVLAIAVLVGSPLGYHHFIWWPRAYPYGWSHSCDKQLYFALQTYAETNASFFPAGEASPEASLSLLARPPHNVHAEILRGKTIPKDVVEAKLNRGELLDPTTCGWHYAEGSRNDDDSQIALFWDKAGLNHNGMRLADGGHSVARINGSIERIAGKDWQAFLEEQKRLIDERDARRAKKAANELRSDDEQIDEPE